jgi:hypothetical protein
VHPLRERILAGALCRHLRTKGMYVAGEDGPPPEIPHVPDAAHFWCNLSGWALGPDAAPANPGRCGPGRGCFDTESPA